MYQKYKVCISNFQNVRVRMVLSAAKRAPAQVFPQPKSPAQGFSADKLARPGLFRGQNNPPGPKSLKFHRKSAPPDLPEAPGVPPGLHAALGMDLGWFGEGHMRSSMVNSSKYNKPRMPREPRERPNWWQEVQLGAPFHMRRGPG